MTPALRIFFPFSFSGSNSDDNGRRKAPQPGRTSNPLKVVPKDISDVQQTEAQARDAALVERIRAGDAQALGALMQHYALQLATVAAAMLRSDELAEDIVQDVLLSLWEHRASFDIRTNVAGYLRQAVRNRTLNVLRRERSQLRIATSAAERDSDLARVAHNDAEQSFDAADLHARVYAALEHVAPSPRQVFLLSWEAGLTYQEIADLLGITVRSVSQQMYRATGRLAEHFSRRE